MRLNAGIDDNKLLPGQKGCAAIPSKNERMFEEKASNFRDMLVFRGVILKKGMYSTHATHTKSILQGVDDPDHPILTECRDAARISSR